MGPAPGLRHAEAQADQATEMRAFLQEVWPAAQARGVSRALFDAATAGLTPDPDVVDLAGRQPELTRPTGDYIAHLVTEARVEAGRQLTARHAALLQSIEAAYGVDRHVLVAIWGVESAYGTSMGTRSVVRSLATLAMQDARRTRFWRGELVAALRILQEGAATPSSLVGSWAGAMGHTQFIPSTYVAHAVDFDKDGKRDVWNTVADALASTARYLQAMGWAAHEPWGFEVTLPEEFDYAWSAPGKARPLELWQVAGVRAVGTGEGRATRRLLQLILPAGARGPAFLVTSNYNAILKYNQSTAYALAVGHLAHRIAGGAPLAAAWPAEGALDRASRQELQQLLAARGHDTGGLDGIIGDQTRAAIRATQRSLKLVEDGHPSVDLLHRLRGHLP